jgi:hypothetical protein
MNYSRNEIFVNNGEGLSITAILACQAIVTNDEQMWASCKESNEIPDSIREMATKQFSNSAPQRKSALVKLSYFLPSRLLMLLQVWTLWSPKFSYRILRATGVHQQHF